MFSHLNSPLKTGRFSNIPEPVGPSIMMLDLSSTMLYLSASSISLPGLLVSCCSIRSNFMEADGPNAELSPVSCPNSATKNRCERYENDIELHEMIDCLSD